MSQDIAQIKDHAARALARLLTQYKGKPLIAGLFGVFAPQIQQVEDMLFGVLNGLRLENAVGEQLDLIGRILGQAREAAGDDEYRLRLAARRAANNSIGAAEDLYKVFRILLGATVTLTLEERYPAGFLMQAFSGTGLSATLIPLYNRFLADTKAAGVYGQLIYSLVSSGTTFTLSSQQAVLETSSLLGLANDTQTTGGHLAGVIIG